MKFKRCGTLTATCWWGNGVPGTISTKKEEEKKGMKMMIHNDVSALLYISWVGGCVHGCVGTWVRGYMGAWVHGCMGA